MTQKRKIAHARHTEVFFNKSSMSKLGPLRPPTDEPFTKVMLRDSNPKIYALFCFIKRNMSNIFISWNRNVYIGLAGNGTANVAQGSTLSFTAN